MKRTLAALSLALLSPFSAHAATPSKVSLALNWKPEPEFGGFYAAQAEGSFKKRGLDVTILEGGAGTPVVQMLAAGKADYGIVEADEIILSQERGSDVTALFAVYQMSPMGIMIRGSRPEKTLKEVMESPGKLAIQPGSNYSLFLKEKYPKAKVSMVPYLGGVGNFLEDPAFAQQCFVTSEPLAAKKKGTEARTFLFASEGFNPYVTVLAARAERIKNHPDEVKAMVEAVREGWASYVNDAGPANTVMSKLNTSMDLQTFGDIAREQLPLLYGESNLKGVSVDHKALGTMSESRWTELISQLKKLKVIKGTVAASKLFHLF